MNGQGNAGKRAAALKLRKETGLSTRAIAKRVNAADSTVQRWLKGIKAGEPGRGDSNQVTRRQPSLLASSDSVSQVKATHSSQVQGKKQGKSEAVQKVFDKAALIVKKVKAKKIKKPKPVYIPATLEQIDPEPIPDPEETQETADLEEKPKRKSGFGVWALLIILVIVIVVVIIGLIDKRKEQFDLSEQEQKPVFPTNPDGLGGEIDFTRGL